MYNRIRFALCLVLLFCISVLPALSANLKCFVLRPPDQALSKAKKLAINDFTGAYGRELTDYLTAALLVKNRGITQVSSGFFSKKEGVTYLSGARTDIFTLVERSQLEQVKRELSLESSSGLIDENQAASLGKGLGVDAIVIGTVAASSKDEHDTRKDYEGKSLYCTTRKASVSVHLRIVDVSTHAILGTKEASYENKDDQCGSDVSKLETAAALIGGCLQELANHDLADYIAPKFELNKFDFKDIDVKEYREIGRKAERAIDDGKLDNAYLFYASIVKEDTYNDAAYFDMGVLNEVVGNYQDALDNYQKALGIRQDDDYAKAVDHCKKANEFNQVLTGMGVAIEKHVFSVSEAQMASATAERIKLRGDRGDRIELRQTAEDAGVLVAKVPGGIELEVVERSGDWIKVKTFDGKVGFVNKKDLR